MRKDVIAKVKSFNGTSLLKLAKLEWESIKNLRNGCSLSHCGKQTVSRQFLLLVTDSKVFVSVRFSYLPAIEAGKLFPFPIIVMDNTNSQPHGTDVFNTHWNCPCKKCGPKREAIRRLIDSFSQISSTWIEELATLHGEFLPLPMWGTIFIPQDSADVSNIEKLLCEIETDNEEEETFASAGWQEVGRTGIYAIEFDGELLLGIHGAGYDFYSQHWFKLYDALGYKWHEVTESP